MHWVLAFRMVVMNADVAKSRVGKSASEKSAKEDSVSLVNSGQSALR